MISLFKDGSAAQFSSLSSLNTFGLKCQQPVKGTVSSQAEAKSSRAKLPLKKSYADKTAKLSDIFSKEGVSRFNSVMDNSAFISVSKGFESRQAGVQDKRSTQQSTYVRLWSLPPDGMHLGKSTNVEILSPVLSDQLVFCGKNVQVAQSPDGSLIAVTSENMIGIYELKVRAGSAYFKWNSSYTLPDDCTASKATFHVGSAALSIESSTGDIDWIEIKKGMITELTPKHSDRVKFGLRSPVL